jgi:penicillin-binding protein 1B
MVSLNEALKQSLNIPTAKLGIEVGLEKIVETVKLFGLESPTKPVPALTLGAFEMSLLEVLRAYMGLNNMGDIPKTSFIRKIASRDGTVIWTFTPEFRSYEDKAAVAETVGVLKNAVTSGTGAGINKSGFQWPSAGKTGTTSDYKDAWFVGFTRNITSLVWLGYDNNTPHKLTGASGPLSIWLEFMNKKMAPYKAQDFEWPEDVESKVEGDQTLILRK